MCCTTEALPHLFFILPRYCTLVYAFPSPHFKFHSPFLLAPSSPAFQKIPDQPTDEMTTMGHVGEPTLACGLQNQGGKSSVKTLSGGSARGFSPAPSVREPTLNLISGNFQRDICLCHAMGPCQLGDERWFLEVGLPTMDSAHPMMADRVWFVCLTLAQPFLFFSCLRCFSLPSPSVTASSALSAFSFIGCTDHFCISCFCAETETASHHKCFVSASFPFY